jgi:hypothetical protein
MLSTIADIGNGHCWAGVETFGGVIAALGRCHASFLMSQGKSLSFANPCYA